MSKLACILLAGGLGTRMNSGLPKVLQTLMGKPMIRYALDSALALRPEKTVVVIGEQGEAIKNELKEYGNRISYALQDPPLGTAHAFQTGYAPLKNFKGNILVINADSPLVTSGTLKELLREHRKNKNALSLASFRTVNPSAYGRIVRNAEGSPLRIVEQTDLSGEDLLINEVNSGIYIFEPQAAVLSSKIKKNRKKGEFYLTDILELAVRAGLSCGVYPLADEREFAGVNTFIELEEAERVLRARMIKELMLKGVKVVEPRTLFLHHAVKIGPGSTIYPNVHLEGKTTIGRNCIVFPNSRIVDSLLQEGSVVKDSSLVENSKLERNSQVGPFAHIRPGSIIGRGAKIGNFVEVKNSVIGKGTKAQHLSYIGDSDLGRGVNIGAGTITCNYDGFAKNRTIIEDGVFIGSDSQLIAPVRIEKGSYVGAGSTIRKDVPRESLALSRAKQEIVEGWARKRKARLKKPARK